MQVNVIIACESIRRSITLSMSPSSPPRPSENAMILSAKLTKRIAASGNEIGENVPNFGFTTHASTIVSKLLLSPQVQLFFLINTIELKILKKSTSFYQ